MTVDEATLRSHLDRETAERGWRTTAAFLRIPSISALPEHAADSVAPPSWLASGCVGSASSTSTCRRQAAIRSSTADWLHAAGAPTAIVYGHYDVQPVDPLDPGRRRRSSRSSRATGSGPRRRPTTRARFMHPLRRAGGDVRDARRGCRSTCASSSRARRRRRSEHLDAVARGQSRAPARRTSRSSRDTGFFEGNLPAITVGLRGIIVRADRRSRPVQSTCTRARTAAPSRTRPTRSPRSSRRSRAPTAASAFRASTTTCGRSGRRIARRWHRCRSTMRRTRRDGGDRRSSARPAISTLERRWARARRSTSTACGRASRARAARRSSRPHAHAKVSCRLVPDQDPEQIFERFRDYVRSVAPPGVTVEVRSLGTRPPEPDADRTRPRRPRRARSRRAFGRAPVYIREGGSIPFVQTFESLWVCPSSCSGSSRRDDNVACPERVDGPDQLRDAASVRRRHSGTSSRASGGRWRRSAGRQAAPESGADRYFRAGAGRPVNRDDFATGRCYDARSATTGRIIRVTHGAARGGRRSEGHVAARYRQRQHGAPLGARRPGRPQRPASRAARSVSTSRSRSASRRSTRRSGPACAPASSC